MKNLLRLASFLLVALTFVQCEKVVQTTTYTANVPSYMTFESLRSAVHNDNARELEKPGKIFLYNQYIFINEFEQGVHIYNNSNPQNPAHEAFISIPGNVDIAVKDGVLYADSYIDIVSIDITDPANAKEIGRSEDVLSYTIPHSIIDFQYPVSEIDQSKGVVSGFTIAEVSETCVNGDCGGYYHDNMAGMQQGGDWGMMSETGSPVSFSGNATNARTTATPQGGSGIAGSMARFLLVDDHLFAISNTEEVRVFQVQGSAAVMVNTFFPARDAGGWSTIETLFEFNDRLFIGSNNGMYTYDVSNPASPRYLSMHEHFTACDPVVANDEYAFITLRGGNTCGGVTQDMLEIVDISDIMRPSTVEEVWMSNPHGLAIDNEDELVFVCDGTAGLKVYNYSERGRVGQNKLAEVNDMQTYDVISFRNILHVIGTDGLRQYEYNSSGNLQTLSTIALGK